MEDLCVSLSNKNQSINQSALKRKRKSAGKWNVGQPSHAFPGGRSQAPCIPSKAATPLQSALMTKTLQFSAQVLVSELQNHHADRNQVQKTTVIASFT